MAARDAKERDPYRGRHRRQAAVFTLVFLLVAGVGVAAGTFYFGYWQWPGSSTASATQATPTPTGAPCPPPVTELPPPPEVPVAVLNATDRAGLASRTGEELLRRGYAVVQIGNDPVGAPVPEPAQVRYGLTGRAAAVAAWALVEGAVLVDDGRTTPEVDLVLGDGFEALVPTGVVPAPLPELAPPPGCVPAG